MKKAILAIILFVIGLYLIICLILYAKQENVIFYPQKLAKDFKFQFEQPFEEIDISSTDGAELNGLLFKAGDPKGVILYLHGNGGALDTWGDVATIYTSLNYDVFILDYPGYGKSEGEISSQEQLFQDIQIVYDKLKERYTEDKIIILGYSIGTGPAAHLASDNNPKLLILQAPYYSLVDMMKQSFTWVPTFILKYKFETNAYLKKVKVPVVIFHGNQDEVIYYGSSLKLKEEFKKGDTLITLEGQGHNGITDNSVYKSEMKRILSK